MNNGNEMIWAELTHLGMNFWGDLERALCPFRWMESPEAAEGVRTQYTSADYVRFDEGFWRDTVVPSMLAGGVNMIVIDLGEGVIYPSHPELAVKGSWPVEKLRAELARLRGLGFEVVPKLNFSSSHDIWLKEYHRMLSTPEYYRVCRDVIRDAVEIFDHPRFIHLGLDEETAHFQAGHSQVMVRQGDLWWHDVLLLIHEVEKYGARAWIWSDYIRRHPLEEFTARMPKSVVQSPWTYSYSHFQESAVSVDASEDRNIEVMFKLLGAGYDVIPCGSNCYGCKSNLEDLVHLFRQCPEEKRRFVKGFFHAPWLMTRRCFERRFRELGEQVANSIAIWNGTDLALPWKGRVGADGPEMYTLDASAADFEKRLAALPRRGAWISIDVPDDKAVAVARHLALEGRLAQAIVTAGPEALKDARNVVPRLLLGYRGEVHDDRELTAVIFGDYRLARLAKDAKVTTDRVNHFRGWRGLTLGDHPLSDFRG